jgi:hypothetical protein
LIDDKEGTSHEIELVEKCNAMEEETLLYNGETRQQLVNDLEEV